MEDLKESGQGRQGRAGQSELRLSLGYWVRLGKE